MSFVGVPGLTEREAEVLNRVIHSYILSANPVGSRTLAKTPDMQLGAATIRNVMADLEDKGLLCHPHTSAGRIPTDLGYRIYVNYLMQQVSLSASEKQLIVENVQQNMPDVDMIMGRTAHLLSTISHNLGIVLAPSFEEGRLEHLDIVPLGLNRILVVITVESGLARTVTLEIEQRINRDDLPIISRMIRQRLVGQTLKEIRNTITERLSDLDNINRDVARLFIDSTTKLFEVPQKSSVIIEGARNIIDVPEFREEGLSSVLEILEDREIVLHLINRQHAAGQTISIGAENEFETAADYSLISAEFQVGSLPGTLGIIGPRRMNYSKLISLVRYTAKMINKELCDKSNEE
jgi:heat-inducible transcriptional repressor